MTGRLAAGFPRFGVTNLGNSPAIPCDLCFENIAGSDVSRQPRRGEAHGCVEQTRKSNSQFDSPRFIQRLLGNQPSVHDGSGSVSNFSAMPLPRATRFPCVATTTPRPRWCRTSISEPILRPRLNRRRCRMRPPSMSVIFTLAPTGRLSREAEEGEGCDIGVTARHLIKNNSHLSLTNHRKLGNHLLALLNVRWMGFRHE